MGYGSKFNIKHDEIGTPGGGVISFAGMNQQNSESIKSYENYSVCWVEEASVFSARSLELIRPTIRAPQSELWFSWNPHHASDPVDKFFRGLTPPDNAIIRKVTYEDNDFLPDEMLEEMEIDRENNPDRFAHIWLGEYAPQAVGAIWNMTNIHENRQHDIPMLRRILVSVDPAISNTDQSDEHGIICGGIGEDNRGYIIDDVSMRGSPQQWAERAVATYDKYEADAIVVERNQGGDMVRHTIKTVRPQIKIVEVTATRGKHVRAEPISALYATNQVSHVGSYPELEAQMCRMTSAGYEGDGSPDRCDALVWLLTELFPSIIKRPKRRNYAPKASSWMG
tara:strand:- start:3541 stop:4554 length:1014 start_codon:yes stop_codon:yes gene_type:complete